MNVRYRLSLAFAALAIMGCPFLGVPTLPTTTGGGIPLDTPYYYPVIDGETWTYQYLDGPFAGQNFQVGLTVPAGKRTVDAIFFDLYQGVDLGARPDPLVATVPSAMPSAVPRAAGGDKSRYGTGRADPLWAGTRGASYYRTQGGIVGLQQNIEGRNDIWLVAFPLTVGQQWQGGLTIWGGTPATTVDHGPLIVPYGAGLDAFHVRESAGDVTTDCWYAANVGLAKVTESGGTSNNATYVLVDYRHP